MTNHNLIPLEDIFAHQDKGEWPMVDSPLLSTTYKNRWEMADKLFSELDENLFLAARNIPNVDVRDAASIDPVSLIAYDKVLVTVGALKQIEEALA